MNRWSWFAVCALGGLALLVLGLLIPIHLRAVEASVIRKAGERTPALIDHGLALVREEKLGAARLFLQATTPETFPDREKLRVAADRLAAQQPALILSGGDVSPRIERLFASDPQPPKTDLEPLTDVVVRLENREVVLEFLTASTNVNVRELIRCRALNGTVIFSPSMSASGQAFDAALSIAGLLIEENRLNPRLRDSLVTLASQANRGASSQPLEQSLLDLMSLGQRFNWGQMCSFVGNIQDAETLRIIADQARHDERVPVLFCAVELSGQPGAVVHYLMDFSQNGLADLRSSLQYGAGGVVELVHRDQRLTQSSPFVRRFTALPVVRPLFQFTVDCARWTPLLAFLLKWLCYLAGGFLIAVSMHFAHAPLSALDQPLQVPVFQFARETLFALGFLAVLLLVSEPFLSDNSQKTELPFRIHLPAMGGIAHSKTTPPPPTMNQTSQLLTLVLFFVLQGLLYMASLAKLAEIRRQHAPARVRIKLLENEEHLFDAGLYLGFCGTIVSFILGSLGLIHGSLMGAYSSTAFGIVFVSLFKIFQLRPARRQLLLESEATPAEPPTAAPIATPAMTTP